MKATYNITTNRFKVWFDERLSPEDYKRAKDCNFVWYPGQKCFSSIWYPQSEDFIKSFGIEIEEDDTPDDVESRVNRFEKYAEHAENEASAAQERALNANTERRQRLAAGRAESEIERAQHWADRIAGAIAHAAHKDSPRTIANRIKGLLTDLHRVERSINLTLCSDGNYLDKNHHWIKPENVESHKEHAQRWINHYNRRIEYETAYLEAVGGIELLTPEKAPRRVTKAPEDGLKKGMKVICSFGYYGQNAETEPRTLISLGARNVRVSYTEKEAKDYSSYCTPAVIAKGREVLRKHVKAA